MIPLAICLTIISLLISIAVFFVYIYGDTRNSAKMIGGGIAEGVTKSSTYKNYILASDDNLYKRDDSMIDHPEL